MTYIDPLITQTRFLLENEHLDRALAARKAERSKRSESAERGWRSRRKTGNPRGRPRLNDYQNLEPIAPAKIDIAREEAIRIGSDKLLAAIIREHPRIYEIAVRDGRA